MTGNSCMTDELTVMPIVTIVIINWNGKDHVLDCLDSISKLNYPQERYRVLIIDNCSTDHSQELIKEAFPNYQMIINPRNYGCAEAENQGIKFSIEMGADFIWLLNNDVILHQDALIHLIEIAQSDNNIAVLGPAIYSFDRPDIEDNIGYKVNLWTGRFKNLSKKYKTIEKQTVRILDVDSVQGCSILIRVSAFHKIGIFHAAYEAYFEESEFNIRAIKMGFRVVTVRDSIIWHKKSASYNRIMLRRAFLLLRNLVIFEWRNAPKRKQIIFLPYFLGIHLPYFIIRGSLYALNYQFQKYIRLFKKIMKRH
ncbi:glycosyltransferase [Candidatus Magnetomorum sp. HK-1]|nr:glycosyltransferase [Candidatus Magnetomorum sp. HK-1]